MSEYKHNKTADVVDIRIQNYDTKTRINIFTCAISFIQMI